MLFLVNVFVLGILFLVVRLMREIKFVLIVNIVSINNFGISIL